MVTGVKPFMTGGAAALASLYKYDQLNRIVEMQTYSSMNLSTNAWNSGTLGDDFQTNYTYNANGNILTLKRNTDASTNKTMDSLNYLYKAGTNQLTYVTDSIGDGNYPNDIDNQSSDNYDYDAIGNLTKDVKEEIATIDWNVYGKIRKISRENTSAKPDLEFQDACPEPSRRDASGQRIIKIVKPTLFEGTWKKTYYARDAQGNVMATYGSKNYIDGDTNAFHSVNDYIYTYIGIDSLKSMVQNNFNGNSQFAGAYTQLLASVNSQYTSLIANYTVDSLMTWDNATSAIILDNFCAHMSTIRQNDLLNTWVSVSRGNVEEAIQGANFSNALTALLNADNADEMLLSLGNINSTGLQTMYQMAGGPMPAPNTAGQVQYLRMNLTNGQIVGQLFTYFTTANLDQMLGTLTSGLYNNAFAVGNGVYDACDLFSDIAASEPTADITTIIRDNYGYKTDLKNILVSEANAEYLLRLCSRNDWSNFVSSSISLDYKNVSRALSMVNYDLGKYLGFIQQQIGKSSFGTMLSSLDLTITQKWEVNEHFLYGSSRLGVYRSNKMLRSETFTITDVDGTTGEITGKTMLDSFIYVMRTDSFTRVLTEKNYELVNHLGNVLATISDRRTPISSGGTHIDYYESDVTNATLYYPFGMEMKTYQADSNGYRYGFGGMEKDDAIKGSGNSLDFGARIYDSRLGRWMSTDRVASIAPAWTPYRSFFDNPNFWIDRDGNIEWPLEGTHIYYSHQHKKISYKHYVRGMPSIDHAGKTYTYAYKETASTTAMTSAQRAAKAKGNLITVTSEFFRIRDVGTSPHIGVDFSAKVGTDVYSLADGTITAVETAAKGGTGRYIVVEYEDGVKVRFLHLSKVGVKKGDKVFEGQIIGQSGNSGGVPKHLHMDATDKDGNMIDPTTLKLGSATNSEFFTTYGGSWERLRDSKIKPPQPAMILQDNTQCISCLLIANTANFQLSQEVAKTTYIVTTQNDPLRYYSSSTDSNKQGLVEKGTEVESTGNTENGRTEVIVDGKKVWVSSKYIKSKS